MSLPYYCKVTAACFEIKLFYTHCLYIAILVSMHQLNVKEAVRQSFLVAVSPVFVALPVVEN